MSERFPVSGDRQAVYAFMREHGFKLAGTGGDKHWIRSDGVEARIYGAGSRLIVYGKGNKIIANDRIEEAMTKLPPNGWVNV